MIRLIRSAGLAAASAFLCLAGCGESAGPVDRERTVPVTGTVTYNGTPVADASVSLVPETPVGEAASKKGAFGKTDASGKFTLTTFEPGDGAVPGNYKVTVRKYEGETSTAAPQESDDYVPPEEVEDDTPSAAPKSLLPEKYS